MLEVISKVRVNVKSLAAEAKIIRAEYKKTKFFSLDSHRRHRVREEARYAHLTLAFLRKMRYKELEQKTKHPVDPAKLYKKIIRYTHTYEDIVINWLKS